MADGLYDKLKSLIAKAAPALTQKVMREEISPPGGIYARSPFEGHLAFGMRPDRLAAIIRAADSGSTRDWFILAEEIEELFPHYLAVLSKRKRQVCQLPITVEAASDDAEHQKHAELVRDWVATGVLQSSLFNIMDAVGKGFSVSEILWDTTPEHFWPCRIAYRKTSWFEVNWLDGEEILLRTEEGYQQLAPHKFLIHKHPAKTGGLVRSGLTRLIAFLWMFSTFTLRDWAIFTQAYGLPIRVGRYGPEASEEDKRVLWRAVSSIAGDVAAIIPKSMEMEFVKGGDRTADTKLYEGRADWLNREVSKIVLGSTAGTEAIAGGHAVGKEHRQVEEDVERYDAGLISTSITKQIVKLIVDFTFGEQADKQYPTLHIGRPDEVPLKDVIDGVADLGGMGLRVKADEIRDRLGLTKPADGDEVIGGVVAPPPTIPHPVVTPPDNVSTNATWLGQLISLHAETPVEIVDLMAQRLARDAAGAMQGLGDDVRAVFEEARDMNDLAERLSKLQLNSQEFGMAMSRGIALAQMVGQAALVGELQNRKALQAAAGRADLGPEDFAVPGKRALRIDDEKHVRLAWDMVDRTQGLSPAERRQARRRILRKAQKLGIDTSKWEQS